MSDIYITGNEMFLQPKLRFDDLVLEKSVYDIAVITNHVR